MKHCKRKITCGIRVETEEGNFFGAVTWYKQVPSKALLLEKDAGQNYSRSFKAKKFFFLFLLLLPPMPPHVLMNFHGFPPGCGDSSWLLRLGRLWGATTLSRWCEWWYAGRWNTRRGLKPKSTNYPDHGHYGNLSLQEKIPMVEPGIEPGTSWLLVRDPDH